MITKKALPVAVVSAFIGAFIPTLLALRMMVDNNNNGELLDTVTGQWNVGYALSVSAIFYGASFLLIFAFILGLTRLWSHDEDAS